MRYIFLTILCVMGLGASLSAAPRWETRSWRSPGTNYEGYYGFFSDRNAEQKCRHDESLVSDVLSQSARDANVRCKVTNIQKGSMTIEKVWVLDGTFRVWVE